MEEINNEVIANNEQQLKDLIKQVAGPDPFWAEAIKRYFNSLNKNIEEKIDFLKKISLNKDVFNEFTREINKNIDPIEIYNKYSNMIKSPDDVNKENNEKITKDDKFEKKGKKENEQLNMKEQERKAFDHALEIIEKNMILEIEHKTYFKVILYDGIIITNNKEIYKYQYFDGRGSFEEDFPYLYRKKYIKKISTLNDKEFKKVELFIKNELIDKEYQYEMVHDSYIGILVNYDGVSKSIHNHSIYETTEKMLKEIIKKKWWKIPQKINYKNWFNVK